MANDPKLQNLSTFVNSMRVPPQDIDAERALLGSIMLRSAGINEVIDYVTEESFYTNRHKLIYRSMLDLTAKGEPIDLLSLSSKMKEKKNLDEIGGASYLSEIVEIVPSASNLKHYANIVEKKASLRSLINAAELILELGYSEQDEIDYILDEAEKKIFGIKNSSLKLKMLPIREGLTEAWDRLDRLHKHKDELRGIPSGFPDIDNKLAGFQKADLVILAARPSMGKTTLALDIARHAATKYNIPVGIFSIEMSAQQLVDRMLAAEAYVDSWKIRTGRITNDEDFTKIRDALDKLSQAPIYINDDVNNTAIRMKALARRLKSEQNLGLIIIDYLQLMAPQRQGDSMVQQVTEISRSLKGLARELDVPVLALSQLSRAVEQRRGPPRLSDLRDSGSIEQDADVVMFIHRDDKYDSDSGKPNIARLIIAKHRNGPTGEIELYFDEKRTTFQSIERGDFGKMQ